MVTMKGTRLPAHIVFSSGLLLILLMLILTTIPSRDAFSSEQQPSSSSEARDQMMPPIFLAALPCAVCSLTMTAAGVEGKRDAQAEENEPDPGIPGLAAEEMVHNPLREKDPRVVDHHVPGSRHKIL